MLYSYQERLAQFTIGLRPRNNAVAAFLTKNPDASRAIHSNLYDEPHKTNTVRHVRETYMERVIKSTERGLLQTCCIFAVLYGIHNYVSNTWFVQQQNHYNLILNSSLWEFNFILISSFLSISILLGTGLVLGYLDYQSNKEYTEFYNSERKRENWEYDNYIEGEQNEMIQLYISKGLSKQDAEIVIKLMSKDKKFFVDMMMKEELELLPPDERDPFINGIVLFLSYTFIGGIPIMANFIWYFSQNYFSITLTAFVLAETCLFICGTLKSLIRVSIWWSTGLKMALNGLVAYLSGTVASTMVLYIIERILLPL